MSGPKGVAFTVVSAEELRRRELAAAVARVTTRRERLVRLRDAVHGELDAEPAAPSTSMDLSSLQRLEDLIVRESDKLDARLTQERVDAGLSAIAARLGGLRFKLQTSAAPRAPQRRTAPPDLAADAARERLQKALQVAAEIGSPALLESLGELASDAGTAGLASAAGRALVVEIEARVTRAYADRQNLLAVRRRADELEVQSVALLGSDAEIDTEVTSLRGRLRKVSDHSGVDHLARELGILADRARQAWDRRFVLDQAVEVLREMGYALETGEPEEGAVPVVATHRRWPRHGLRLVFRGDEAKVHTRPLSLADTHPSDDVAFEHESCDDIARLRERLDERGVTTTLVQHALPGTVPVKRRKAPIRAVPDQQLGRQR